MHHAAGTGSVTDIHREHLSKGWAGCGYNFYIRLDGSVWLGRGWDAVGAHAGVELIKMAMQKFASITEIKGHKEVYATACPGQYFPLAKFKAVTVLIASKTTDESEEDEEMVRYNKLSDIPSGLRAPIETLMNAGIIQGDGSDFTGNNDVIDLSHDQVRTLIITHRGGVLMQS